MKIKFLGNHSQNYCFSPAEQSVTNSSNFASKMFDFSSILVLPQIIISAENQKKFFDQVSLYTYPPFSVLKGTPVFRNYLPMIVSRRLIGTEHYRQGWGLLKTHPLCWMLIIRSHSLLRMTRFVKICPKNIRHFKSILWPSFTTEKPLFRFWMEKKAMDT